MASSQRHGIHRRQRARLLHGGHPLFRDVSFRVGEGSKVALVGANGTGKTTLLRLIAGDIKPETGSISSSGGIGVMRQFIGSTGGSTTVRDFLLGLAPKAVRVAGNALQAAEHGSPSSPTIPRSQSTTRRPSPTGHQRADTRPR